jgi:acetyl-CoA acetyltransferase
MYQLALEACVAACEDAGVNVKDVDGFVTYSVDTVPPYNVAQGLGVTQTRFINLFPGGGESTAGVVHNAAMAIYSGTAEMVLCYRSLNMTEFGRIGGYRGDGNVASGTQAFQAPFGLVSLAQVYAMQAQRHMHDFGTTSRQLGAISVAAYKHAQRNPHAVMFGRPITIEDHQNSRMIADPYRLYDCCQETDGACAVLVTSAERARSLKQKPVYIMGAAMGGGTSALDQTFTNQRHMGHFNTAGFLETARDLYTRAGVGPKDVDVAQFYETFTGQVLMAIEDFGFCKRGEGGPWVEGGRIEHADVAQPGAPYAGELPINTSGGNLAEGYIHGLEIMLEGVRQMRGTSTCQVEGAEIGLVVAGPSALPSSAMLLHN